MGMRCVMRSFFAKPPVSISLPFGFIGNFDKVAFNESGRDARGPSKDGPSIAGASSIKITDHSD